MDLFYQLKALLGLNPKENELLPKFIEEIGLKNTSGSIKVLSVDDNYGWFDIDILTKVPNTEQELKIKGRVTVELIK